MLYRNSQFPISFAGVTTTAIILLGQGAISVAPPMTSMTLLLCLDRVPILVFVILPGVAHLLPVHQNLDQQLNDEPEPVQMHQVEGDEHGVEGKMEWPIRIDVHADN